MNNLTGKAAIVTGSGSGIGRASAIALAAAGAQVAVADLDIEAAKEVATSIIDEGGDAYAVGVDVCAPSSCEKMVGQAVEQFGKLDVLHCCAGIASAGDGFVGTIEPGIWDSIIQANLNGAFYCAHFALKAMKSGGSIVLTASSMAHLPTGLMNAYAASKGGVVQLARSMALGCGTRGIRVNAISPGYVRTPMTADMFDHEDLRTSLERCHATGLQTPEEVAEVVVFLASNAARSLTGAVLTCDRGWTSFKAPEYLLKRRVARPTSNSDEP